MYIRTFLTGVGTTASNSEVKLRCIDNNLQFYLILRLTGCRL